MSHHRAEGVFALVDPEQLSPNVHTIAWRDCRRVALFACSLMLYVCRVLACEHKYCFDPDQLRPIDIDIQLMHAPCFSHICQLAEPKCIW